MVRKVAHRFLVVLQLAYQLEGRADALRSHGLRAREEAQGLGQAAVRHVLDLHHHPQLSSCSNLLVSFSHL